VSPLKPIVAPALTWIVAGVLIGLVLTADLKLFGGWLRSHWPWAGMLLGALIGGVGAAAWILRAQLPFTARVTSVKVELPMVGKLEMALTPDERSFLWRFFVELVTRVSTQSLGAQEGILREALKSLHDLYSVARSELGSAPPTTLPFSDISARAYVIDILNKQLRPFLSRWHPLLSAWEKTNLPEAAWPLAELCRNDLATTRDRILWLTWDLGAALNVQGLDMILPARPGTLCELLPVAAVSARNPSLPLLDQERIKVGWRIFVECASRISTQPLATGTGLLREALDSLYKLFGMVRDELKSVGPTPSLVAAGATVESIAFHLLNCHLRPFLAKWHPALVAWEKPQRAEGKKSEAEWPDADKCRAELDQLRGAMLGDVRILGALIGVQRLDEFLSGGP
jgi:hypothetical protein